MPRQRGLQGIRLVTNDDGHRTGRQLIGGGQDVLDTHRSARNRVKHFGQRRLHPHALARRQHDNVNVRHGVAPSPARYAVPDVPRGPPGRTKCGESTE